MTEVVERERLQQSSLEEDEVLPTIIRLSLDGVSLSKAPDGVSLSRVVLSSTSVLLFLLIDGNG